jgi:prepilin-type N-terminal cleavage/methylation domain-containing protein
MARAQEGFTLIEVLVASTLMAVAVIGTGYFFITGQVSVERQGYQRGAIHCAMTKIQELRGLRFAHEDLQGHASPGLEHRDPGNPVTIDNRGTEGTEDDLTGFRRWIVIDVDDDADGTGESYPDYKQIRVEVAEEAEFASPLISFSTLVAP